MELSCIEELKPKKFNKEKQFWNESVEGGDSITTTELTFVTFNVWFAKYYRQERCQALLQILGNCNADIIGLQEVTPSFLEEILEQEWVRDSYYISDITGVTIQPYGILLLSRLPLRRLFLHDLFSLQNRKVLIAALFVNEQTFHFATVHLESQKPSADIRAEQLAMIFPLLEKSEHSAIVGDFNFCSSWTVENANLDSHYTDLWSVLRSNEPGYTEDTDINLMRLQQTQRKKKARFDRILLRSSSSAWQPKSIQLLGTKPISPAYPDVFPSDHFGLLGQIELRR